MTEQGIQIFRYVVAGVNGLMFTIGFYVVLYHLKIRPDRWRRRMRWLVAKAETEEMAGIYDDDAKQSAKKRREEIDEIKKKLKTHLQEPKTLLNLGFGMLILAIALLSLGNLLYPAFRNFL